MAGLRAQKSDERRRAALGRGCSFCRQHVGELDYKHVDRLRRHVTERGKIRSRRLTDACRRHQRQLAVAVKRAREMALLPYAAG